MSTLKTTSSPNEPSLTRITIISVFTKVILGAGTQVFFPFLPFISGGLRISEIQLGRILGWQGFFNLLSPIFGAVADQRGYKRVINFCLLLSAAGAFTIYFSTNVAIFILGLALINLGVIGANPNIGAYLSQVLPFEKRSRGLGILEYGWALVGILVLPVFGILMREAGWRLPFLVLGILLIVAMVAVATLPTVYNESAFSKTERTWLDQIRQFFDLGSNWRSAMAVVTASMMSMVAGLFLAYTFGTWLSREYGLGPAALGWVAVGLGFADITGSTVVSLTGDRLGKRRSTMISALIGVLGFGLLPLWNQSFGLALTGLFLARFSFEYVLVASIVLMSEQSPEQRGKMFTIQIGMGAISTFVSARFAPVVFEAYGILGVGFVGAVSMLIAWGIVRFLAVERG